MRLRDRLEASARALIVCAAVVAPALWATATSGPALASSADGQKIADRVCAGCHATGGPVRQKYQGVDVPTLQEIAAVDGLTRDALKASIIFPHRPMPGLPLEPAEIDSVVDYILSLR